MGRGGECSAALGMRGVHRDCNYPVKWEWIQTDAVGRMCPAALG